MGIARAGSWRSWLGLVGIACACMPPAAGAPYPNAEPLASAAAPAAAPTTTPPAPKAIARYFDRKIDLGPFLAGFPYGEFQPSLRTHTLFFLEHGDTYTLRMLDVEQQDGTWDLAAAPAVSDVDWSKRSLGSIHHDLEHERLWLLADANNDEHMNLWTLDLESGELEQVTKADSVHGFGVSDDEQSLAYLQRNGKHTPYRTCLRLRDLESGREREITCDNEALRFTGSRPRFTPDADAVYLNAQSGGDRNRVQLVRLALVGRDPTPTVITDTTIGRNRVTALEGWLGDELLFLANDDGFTNLYAHDEEQGTTRQITRFREDLVNAFLTEGKIVGVHRSPAGSTAVVIDPESGKLLSQRSFPGTVDVLDARNGTAILQQTAPDIVFEAYFAALTGEGLARAPRVIALDAALARAIVQCEAKAVAIPTFDEDPTTGLPRTLHAFLLEPREPAEDASTELALVTGFYGGANRYGTFENIMCAAGLTVLSPAVRGSTGFGKGFESLNDRDLGGDEIVDLFFAARWLEAKTGLPSRRVGVYGGSLHAGSPAEGSPAEGLHAGFPAEGHGGYATMRALTFPSDTTRGREPGVRSFYPFGFGLAHAGISDIKSVHDSTNIPDWVVLEIGDPNVSADLARMKDRSPIQHVDRLRAPLLLTHGTRDARVPVDESRRFARAARALGRPVNAIEIEGQGHHVEGLGLQVQVYQARFDFLMAVARAAP